MSRATLDVRDRARGAAAGLLGHVAVAVPRHVDEAACARWTAGVYAAKALWTADFGGEQFSLGRAFYTHLEQGRSKAYFDDAAASDARVEAHAPGLQAAMRALMTELLEADVAPRRGWCGPGVHVFPAGGHVAKAGGVIHFDLEGLTAHHVSRRARAVTAVVMLQPPATGGGLRVWDVAYAGRDGATDEEIASPSVLAAYGVGDVVLIDSYQLHQIQPFGGARDRISATIHAAEVDRGRWETWF